MAKSQVGRPGQGPLPGGQPQPGGQPPPQPQPQYGWPPWAAVQNPGVTNVFLGPSPPTAVVGSLAVGYVNLTCPATGDVVAGSNV